MAHAQSLAGTDPGAARRCRRGAGHSQPAGQAQLPERGAGRGVVRGARHRARRPRHQGGDHQGRGHLLQLRARSAFFAQGQRRAARLGSADADGADGGSAARLSAHRHRPGARLLPRRRARHHELPRSGVRRRRCAARHAGNSARQFRPARHLDPGARRHPAQEGRADAARRPQYFRRRGRPLGHHLAGRAGGGTWSRR